MAGAEIVISYRREDIGDAGRLSDWLGAHFGPERVFMDVTGIRGAENFPAAIGQAIGESKAIVAVITANWGSGFANSDDWVRRELREALEAERPIVPVLLHGAQPPQLAALPPELAAIAEVNAIAIDDHDFDDDVERLIEILEGLGVEPPDFQAFPELPKQGRVEARDAWVATGRPDRVGDLLGSGLAQRGLKFSGTEGDQLLIKGGNRLAFRLIGGFFGPDSRMPVRGRVRFSHNGISVAIEVLLVEDLGSAFITGLNGRYESHFRNVLADLRQATA